MTAHLILRTAEDTCEAGCMARIAYFSETRAINRVPENVARSRAPEAPSCHGPGSTLQS